MRKMIVIHVDYCQISFQLHSGKLLNGQMWFSSKLSGRQVIEF